MLSLAWLIGAVSVGGFPGPDRQVASPDGARAIIWEAPLSGDPEFTHHLVLEDRGTGRRTPLMPFFRNVRVEWAPSGRHLAVTCRCGSDFSDVMLFDAERPSKGMSVTKELQRRVGRLEVLSNHHAYVESIGWLDDGALRVRLWGYGEVSPGGVEREYVFELVGKARLVRTRDTLPSSK